MSAGRDLPGPPPRPELAGGRRRVARPPAPPYRSGVRALALALAVALPAVALGAGERAPGVPEAVERRREAIARDLVRMGAAIQREIERGDVPALLARVPDDGLRCGPRKVPKARVARDLRAPASWLHGVFFGGPGYAPPPRTPPSLAALFASAREIAVVVSFHPDARAGPVGRPCLDFRAQDHGTPGAPLCFEKRGGRWWFTESLYPCR